MHLWRPRRLQDRGERTPRPCSAPRTVPRPLALCLGAASPVPAALWPHRRVVPASLMAQRTGNQPPADTGKTVQMGCRGGVLAPADPVPPDSPLRPLSSPATLPVTVHPCRAAGVASLILPRMATSPPCPPGSCRTQSSKLRHFQSVLTRDFWDFYGFPPSHPRPHPQPG